MEGDNENRIKKAVGVETSFGFFEATSFSVAVTSVWLGEIMNATLRGRETEILKYILYAFISVAVLGTAFSLLSTLLSCVFERTVLKSKSICRPKFNEVAGGHLGHFALTSVVLFVVMCAVFSGLALAGFYFSALGVFSVFSAVLMLLYVLSGIVRGVKTKSLKTGVNRAYIGFVTGLVYAAASVGVILFSGLYKLVGVLISLVVCVFIKEVIKHVYHVDGEF